MSIRSTVLLKSGADPNNIGVETRQYALVQAMTDVKLLRLLLNHGYKPSIYTMRKASKFGIRELRHLLSLNASAADLDDELYATIVGTVHEVRKIVEQDQLLKKAIGLTRSGSEQRMLQISLASALVDAIALGLPKLAQLLRERGATVKWSKLVDADHLPARLAYDAAFMNHLDRLRQLEAVGMPLEPSRAAALSRHALLKELMAAKQVDPASDACAIALYFAAAFGQEECVRDHLDDGVDAAAQFPSWEIAGHWPNAACRST